MTNQTEEFKQIIRDSFPSMEDCLGAEHVNQLKKNIAMDGVGIMMVSVENGEIAAKTISLDEYREGEK